MSCRLLKALLLPQQVTAILYANPEWAPAHGGELRLWLPPAASDRCSSEGASVANNPAPHQHNNGSPALHDHTAPDRLHNATTSAPAPDDRDALKASASAAVPGDHAAPDSCRSESALTSTCDDHAAADTHDCEFALDAAHCDYVAVDSHSSEYASAPAPDGHAGTDSGSAFATA